ncbi:MAG TPA: pyridoxamine 5'-phosphate oxidase family protein [Desulfovibrio sp.]|uniref:pyridoxamine 5'-phosphate oxidase family protein n=1 Tax=Desulfovibrio sp. TaxID=885 RepID=UPI002D469904|nr:pyridoxamine 5'-phosphate oxidase family protein [Desulfovibrio sp.]HZF61020.1 pyridoxamine 5'-phosphate oxidase family protein [Desulfovibrio sp.]
MQLRMKEHPLTTEQMDSLLDAVQVGHLATLGENGFPYVTPVHFVRMNGRIYFHGLAAGQKLKNLRADSRVCFEVEGPHSFIQADTPCDTNTAYQSVIITGNAAVVEDRDVKIAALDVVVAKHTPQHAGTAYPENMLKMTAVVEITIHEITGKYYA